MFARFAERIRPSGAWTNLAFTAPRTVVALAFALLPALVVLGMAYVRPEMTDPERVRDTYARYISGLITAATIAVGFATLSLSRGMKGLGELKTHVESDRRYADRVGEMIGKAPPVGIGPTIALVLDACAQRARELRASKLAAHADDVAARLREAQGDPDRLLRASLDLDAERMIHHARVDLHDERLGELLEVADIGRSYVKTLATQWGLSRMSQAIALASMSAVVVATAVVLAYERGPLAPVVISAALAAVLMPLAIFVAYALRFTFVNQHTLPIGHFVFGPENPDALPAGGRGGAR